MASRYETALSQDVLAKAVEELNEPEDNAERLKAIDKLKKSFIKANPKIELVREDDGFLLRFLRARKFNQRKALTMLTNYHVQTASWSEVFNKVKQPATVSHILEAGIVVPLKGKAKDGSSVVVGRPGFGEKHNLIDVAAAIFLTMEKIIEDEETQVHGVTFIQDFTNFTMDFVVQLTPSVARKFIGITQNTLPLRLKGVNGINEPKVFDIVAAIAQPFISRKVKNRYKLHGSEYSGLYDVVDKSVLPPEYGGTGPELDIDGWKMSILGEGTKL